MSLYNEAKAQLIGQLIYIYIYIYIYILLIYTFLVRPEVRIMKDNKPLVVISSPRARPSRADILKNRETRQVLKILGAQAKPIIRMTCLTVMPKVIWSIWVLSPSIMKKRGIMNPDTKSSTLSITVSLSSPFGMITPNMKAPAMECAPHASEMNPHRITPVRTQHTWNSL
jgi:hypothetical protein